MKKTILKCEILNILYDSIINYDKDFTDEQICDLFYFVNDIHDDAEYKFYTNHFLKIFENHITSGQNNFTSLGIRLQNLYKTQLTNNNTNNLFRITLILIYSSINSSLTKLEEIFAEYKFQPKINNSSNNNNEEGIDNVNDGFNAIVFEIGMEIVRNRDENQNRIRNRNNPIVIVRNVNMLRPRNINQLSDTEKLELLNNTLNDTKNQFTKLINFYKLCHNFNELYINNTFENKFLNNLLFSLYNIVFSSANSDKISDIKVKNTNNDLLDIILDFYIILIKNITQLNSSNNKEKENILIEIAKKRNILHLKEILQIYEKYKEKDEKLKYFNDFIIELEKLVPENETINSIGNNNSNNSNENTTIKDKNICTICDDSVVDTHILPCEHDMCRNCFFRCLSGNKLCPFCRVNIKGIKEDNNFKI